MCHSSQDLIKKMYSILLSNTLGRKAVTKHYDGGRVVSRGCVRTELETEDGRLNDKK